MDIMVKPQITLLRLMVANRRGAVSEERNILQTFQSQNNSDVQ